MDSGRTVLLLEAGGTTQYDLGGPFAYSLCSVALQLKCIAGRDFFAGPVTRFDIPLFWSSLPRYEEYEWQVCAVSVGYIPVAGLSGYRTAQGFHDKGMLQAKGLGGCGTHNAMLYVRCLPSDVESWNMTAEGWRWEEVLQTFKGLENYVPPHGGASGAIPTYHGTGVRWVRHVHVCVCG